MKTSSIFWIFVILIANGMLFFLCFYRCILLKRSFLTFYGVLSRRRKLACAQSSILLHWLGKEFCCIHSWIFIFLLYSLFFNLILFIFLYSRSLLVISFINISVYMSIPITHLVIFLSAVNICWNEKISFMEKLFQYWSLYGSNLYKIDC